MRRAVTFDDVGLTPVHNNVPSREEPILRTRLTNHWEVEHPLLAANMASVIGVTLGDVLLKSGTYPIMHRFATTQEQALFAINIGGQCFLSCGVTPQAMQDVDEVIKKSAGVPLGFCIDIAQGHDERSYRAISLLKSKYKDLEVIAGNVCTEQGYIDLVNAGADAVKVGVGPGAACTTRLVTGFGVPQMQALLDCRKAAFKYKVPIIADGGIRTSGDIVKALAAGASTVMIGKMFAQTVESAGQKRTVEVTPGHGGVWVVPSLPHHFGTYTQEVLYKGQASKEFQREGMTPEGIQEWLPVLGTADALIKELCGGIKSGLTYGGSRDIYEFQKKVVHLDLMFQVGPGYAMESAPRR